MGDLYKQVPLSVRAWVVPSKLNLEKILRDEYLGEVLEKVPKDEYAREALKGNS